MRFKKTYHSDHNCAVSKRKEQPARYCKPSVIDESSCGIVNRTESEDQLLSRS